MQDRQRRKLWVAAALITAAAAIRLMYGPTGARPAPSAPGYYYGPMKAKTGSGYGYEDGRPAPAPARQEKSPPARPDSGAATE